MNYTIKTVFAFILAAVILLPAALTADTNSVSPYRGNEFSMAAFGTYQAMGEKVGDAEGFGAGLEFDYFVFKNFGAALATSKANFQSGAFFENLSIGPVIRLPIGKSIFSPFVDGGIGFNFNSNDDRYYYVGGGIEARWSRHFGTFADCQYIFRSDIKAVDDNQVQARLGVRWAF